jgi:hypothetical protein
LRILTGKRAKSEDAIAGKAAAQVTGALRYDNHED